MGMGNGILFLAGGTSFFASLYELRAALIVLSFCSWHVNIHSLCSKKGNFNFHKSVSSRCDIALARQRFYPGHLSSYHGRECEGLATEMVEESVRWAHCFLPRDSGPTYARSNAVALSTHPRLRPFLLISAPRDKSGWICMPATRIIGTMPRVKTVPLSLVTLSCPTSDRSTSTTLLPPVKVEYIPVSRKVATVLLTQSWASSPPHFKIQYTLLL